MEHLHENQKLAIAKALDDNIHSLFITGAGGTGKSEVIKEIVKAIPEDDLILLAPTQSASQNIGGTTLHSFFKIKPSINLHADNEKELLSFIVKGINPDVTEGKVVIVDEVSMLGSSMLNEIFKRITPKKLILVGDPFQLDPVKDTPVDWSKFCHETVELTHNFRVLDENLSALIAKYRHKSRLSITKTDIAHIKKDFNIDMKVLAFTNKRLSQLQQELLGYTDARIGDKLISFGQCDSCKRLMETKKGHKEVPYFYNNDTLIVTKRVGVVDKDYDLTWFECVREDGADIVINKYNIRPLVLVGSYDDYNELLEKRFKTVQRFQNKVLKKYNVASAGAFKQLACGKPFGDEYHTDLLEYNKLWRSYFEIKNSPYARHASFVSVYKCQGKSYDTVIVDIDDLQNKDQKYVAISRARKTLIII